VTYYLFNFTKKSAEKGERRGWELSSARENDTSEPAAGSG
jgi:hypothetical protein